MKDLADHINNINKADDIESAFDYFCNVMLQNGYDQVTYSLVTDHHSLGLPKMHGLVTSYPEDWMKHYVEKDYIEEDPVVLKVKQGGAPFFWDDLEKDRNTPQSAVDILNKAGDAGLKDGIAIPLFSTYGEVVGLGLARKDVEKTRDYQFLAAAQLLATHFHEKFRFLSAKDNPNNYQPLSDREADVLSWASEGKENADIAMILNISVDTVKAHLKRSYKKLGVNSRSYAITKALLLGLIRPHNIMAILPGRVIAEDS